eukprot:5320088-Amphidinium_carterae.3
MMWVMAFVLMLGVLNLPKPTILGPVRRALAATIGCYNAFVFALRTDVGDVSKATLFLWSELLLVCARRLPVCKQRLRRMSMRIRPYAVSSIITGDPIFVPSPLSSASGTPVRRSLLQIQVEHQLVAGGKCVTVKRRTLLRARKMRATRLKELQRLRPWTTTYNPVGAAGNGDCLFSVLAKIIPGRHSSTQMRKLIRAHAASLLVSGDDLHHTLRAPHRNHLLQLAQLGFPLSLTELDLMAEPTEEAEESVPEASDEGRECSLSDADSVCHIRSLPSLPHLESLKIPMLKVKRNGSLRRILLHTEDGSTVEQAILILKKFLKLNPARIFIASGPTPADCYVLPGNHVLSASDAPYIIKVLSPNELASKSTCGAQAKVAPPGHPTRHAQQAVIGAKLGKPLNKVARTATAGSTQAPLPGAASGSGHQPSSSANSGYVPAPQSSFERWVTEKFATLEQCQLDLRTEIDKLKASSLRQISTLAAPGARHSTAIGARRFAQGGGRVQKVQLDTVARSAQLTFVKDLASVNGHLLNDKLVRHLFNADKKCTLAVFQAKSRAQRFQAVIAALRRMGMDELARSLPSDGVDEHVDFRATDPMVSPPLVVGKPHDMRAAVPLPDLAQLAERINAIEAWAHSIDCIDGVYADGSSSRVKDYLEQLVRQVCGSSGGIPSDLKKAQETWQQRVDAQLLDFRQSMRQQTSESIHGDTIVALKMHLEQKVEEVITQRLAATHGAPLDETVLVPLDLAKCIPQPADGRCMYHSLAAGFADGSSASMLEAELMQHMHTQKVSGVSLGEWKAWESLPTVGDAALSSSPAHWGGAVELASIADARGVRIRVYQKDVVNGVAGYRVIASFGSKSADRSKNVDLLYSDGNHYDLLLVREDEVESIADRQMQDIKAKLAKVEHQLDLCMRLCRRTIIGASQLPAQVTKKVADHALMLQQTSELIRMHTIAITRNWQWTASFVHAGAQKHSSSGRVAPFHAKAVQIDGTAPSVAAATPPPPPPPVGHGSTGLGAGASAFPLIPIAEAVQPVQDGNCLTQMKDPTGLDVPIESLPPQSADVRVEPPHNGSDPSVGSGSAPECLEATADQDVTTSSGAGDGLMQDLVSTGVAGDPLVISDTE